GIGNQSSAVGLSAVIVALVFIGFTGVLLVIDLDRPERFYYVLIRPQWRSWLTRGAYIITGYSILLTLWAVADIFGVTGFRDYLHWPIIVFAVLTAIYTGFLFAQAKGRDFWQDPALVLQMLIHAVSAGSAALLLLSLMLPSIGFDRTLLARTLLGGLIVSALVLAFELGTSHPTQDAERAKNSIARGLFAPLTWLGVAGVGLLFPILLISIGSSLLVMIAAVMTLAGLFLHEHIWVRAPQLIPLS
ncbi:MAG TPA: NrfD/PsrC family molybdoenzyme membrane anchor subunit, partial [Candidatus Binataceae bacterium]|nr:NrfD/PsrC family molybdoenzyme membrane anchor subunit [Candidatus Binataceae bacterium]